jgi:hypothetical protein
LVARGELAWLELEQEGRRPVVVLTRDEAIPRLRNIVVALVTRTIPGARHRGTGRTSRRDARRLVHQPRQPPHRSTLAAHRTHHPTRHRTNGRDLPSAVALGQLLSPTTAPSPKRSRAASRQQDQSNRAAVHSRTRELGDFPAARARATAQHGMQQQRVRAGLGTAATAVGLVRRRRVRRQADARRRVRYAGRIR